MFFRELIRKVILATLSLGVYCQMASAQGDYVTPTDNLIVDGIPRIPASLAQAASRYTTYSEVSIKGWNPGKREVFVGNPTGNVTQLSRVDAPGGASQMIAYLGNVYETYFQPRQADYFVFSRDAEGNESYQLFRYDLATRKSTLLTDGKSRNVEPVWSNSGEWIMYGSNRRNGKDIDTYVVKPLDPKSDRLLVRSEGNYLQAQDWSPDDRKVLVREYVSKSESNLWLFDVATGEKVVITPKQGAEKVSYGDAQFSKDGQGVYITTDRNSEWQRLAYVDLATKQFKYLSDDIKWDVESFKQSPDGKTLAFVTNEDGVSRLHLLNTKTGKESPAPSLPVGVISGMVWSQNGSDLGFTFVSARAPSNVYSIDVNASKVERWTTSETGISTDQLPEAELIHWKSFDGRTISGFLYRPPTKFTGKRPVVIDIHGGPAEEYRPSFWGQDNFLLDELGVAKIYPNVRGSSGYGKTFLGLDDGVLRQDAVKDIGALLDWIKTQPGLDPERVMVAGASYGGYMALSVAADYSERIRAAFSDGGPSDLVTYLEHTDSWRRDIRRAEFGDESNPKTRAFLERIAPLNNAQKIRKPLFVVQGKNDPRVPASEANQMVAAVKKNGTPVWYMLAKDEGHEFTNPRNIEYEYYSAALFIQQFLLK